MVSVVSAASQFNHSSEGPAPAGRRGEAKSEMTMNRWLRRARSALVMGLVWALVWAPVGVLIGLIVDADGSMDEPWPLIGAYPGFLGGVVFAIVLGIVGRRHRFDELSMSRFAGWGAVAGLLVGLLPWFLGTPAPGLPRWLPALVVGTITLMSALSAAGSLVLARRAQRRERVAADAG